MEALTASALRSLPGQMSGLGRASLPGYSTHEGIKNRIVIVSACYSGTLCNHSRTTIRSFSPRQTRRAPPSAVRTRRMDLFRRRTVQPEPKRTLVSKRHSRRKVTMANGRRATLSPSPPQGHFGPAADGAARARLRTSRRSIRQAPRRVERLRQNEAGFYPVDA